MPRRPTPKPRVDKPPESHTPPPAVEVAAGEASVPFWNRNRVRLAVAFLLTAHVALAVLSLVQENPTVDEVIHLPAGLTYWQTGSFRLYRHNPPLVKLVAALPVLAAKPVVNIGRDSWRTEPPNKAAFGHEFMQDNARRYFELFTLGRLVMPAFSVIGGLVVFAWSTRLYGAPGGLLSLSLWVLCPNVLAHSRLITTDMGGTALGVLATFLFWLYLKTPSLRFAALAGIGLGLAELSKFSMIVLYGLWPLLAVVRLATCSEFRKIWTRVVVHAVVVVALSLLVIDLGYGFEGVGIPLGDYEFTCQTLTAPVPDGTKRPSSSDRLLNAAWKHRINRFRGTALGSIPVPLPRHYMLGFDDQKLEAEGVPSKFLTDRPLGPEGDEVQGYPVFLDGKLQQKSWWYYYLMTLIYKVPEGTWLIVLTSMALLALSPRSRASGFDEFAVLVVPAFVLFVMSVFTNINLGLRYVLPIFPYAFIAAGKLAPWAAGLRSPVARGVSWGFVGVTLSLTAAATATIHPHYLAYFNAVSGGPDRGASHLIDSNIDWGQDLVGLRRWLAVNAPGERVGLAYFGQVNPRIFDARGEGFDWFLPPPAPGTMDEPIPRYAVDPSSTRLKPGLYAVSASLVEGLPWRVYDSPFQTYGQTRWAPYSVSAKAFRYFRGLTPFHKIGYSIYLYKVMPEQAEQLAGIWNGQ